MVATLSITEIVSWGILYYGFPVFLAPMEQELGASRVAITGAFTVGMAVAALAAVPVGRWLDRHGPWALMTLGSCLGAALVVAWSRVHSLPALYVVWTLMGLVLAATLYEPAFGAVVRWFPTQNRDRALTTLTLAGALASTIFMPIEAWLLGRAGWRPTLLVLAVILAVLTIPLHAIVLRRQPPHFSVSRRAISGKAGPAERGPGVALGVAAHTPIFWALSLAFAIGSFSTASVTLHLIPYMVESGRSAAAVAAAIGWMGAMQIPGRLLFIAVAGRFGALGVTMAVFVAQAVGLALVAVAPSWSGGLLLVIAVLGAANGMATLARATTLAEVFGPAHYASISGAVALGTNGARAAGPVGASLLYAALG
ncbi:MAG TPA: MFS transporter, partial [Candidatus Dormibacteraeota bacterium]|nr:MFS transporter [Candidatus Dormibacteraeota bacterium]